MGWDNFPYFFIFSFQFLDWPRAHLPSGIKWFPKPVHITSIPKHRAGSQHAKTRYFPIILALGTVSRKIACQKMESIDLSDYAASVIPHEGRSRDRFTTRRPRSKTNRFWEVKKLYQIMFRWTLRLTTR